MPGGLDGVALNIRSWVGAISGKAAETPSARPLRAADRALMAATAEPGQAVAATAAARQPASAWSPERLAMLGQLWGEGFIAPGGEAEALRLTKPLGLSGSHSLLHLGAGLGGGSRAVARASGCYVTAFEQDPELAALGMAAATKAGMAKRAAVQLLDAGKPGFRPNYFHHALSQEALWTVADKKPVLGAMVQAMKVGGQLMLTDLVRAEADPDDAAWRAWAMLERARPQPATETAMTRLMQAMGLDVRITEDISARQVGQVLTGWMDRVSSLVRVKPQAREAALIVREAELWLRRVRLIQEGRLRLLRWHAIRVK
jgi:SAM-dependent methyltransferase